MTHHPTPMQRARVAAWFAGGWIRDYWWIGVGAYFAGVLVGFAIAAAPVQP